MTRGGVGVRLVIGACAVLAALLASAATASATSRLYWTNSTSHPLFQRIGSSNLDGSGQGADLNTSGATLANAHGIVMDPAANKAYWANSDANKISFANLDGSGAGGDLNTTGATVNTPVGLTIDAAGGKIYWANKDADEISFANLDGTGGGDLDTTGATVDTPQGIAVDPGGGKVYWANTDADEVSYASLAGGGGGDLDTTGATVNGPNGVAIDRAAGRIYWGNLGAGKLSYANLDGSGGGGDLDVPEGSTSGPGLSIDLSAGRIYWITAQNPADIFFTKLDGSGTGYYSWGSGTTVIGPTFPTILRVPSNTAAPVVTGTPQFGQQLSCSLGTWAADAPEANLFRAARTFSYQWQLNGSDIDGATSSTYTANAAGDVTCRVTATNAAGSTAQSSNTITLAYATPTITASATPTAKVGGAIKDSVTVSGGYNPAGYLVIRGFLPGNTDCGGNSDFSSVIYISGPGTYDASDFTPPVVGTYRWQVSYGGDRANNYFHSACNEANQNSEVTQATPALSTIATATATIGSPISDQATLSGAYNPTGSITFTAYGPDDSGCTGPAAYTSSAVTVSGSGPIDSSPAFTPAALGTYRWRASYSGDANHAAADSACNDPGEDSQVVQATPTLATTATANTTIGSPISDQATLSGAHDPTGSITFTAYGPNDSSCTGPAVYTSSAVTVSGNGDYANSPAFIPTAVGTYRWRAAYSGDGDNAPVSGACNDANESSSVDQATPALAFSGTPGVTLGDAIAGSATISGGVNPTGSITFRAYGPDDPGCTGPAAYTSSAVAISGNGDYANSPSFTPAAAGTYRWRAAYSGDSDNAPTSTACNATGGSSVVTPASPPPSSDFSFTRRGSFLRVAVSAPGTVSVADAGPPRRGLLLRPSSASGGPATIVVPLRLTKRAKTKLRRNGKVTVVARITFTPSGGNPGTRTTALKIRVKKKRSRAR